MTTRALVLGGGGIAGVAWETGLLAALAEAGVDVSNAGLIVGTSAGSVVGAQLALGRSPADLLAVQLEPANDLPPPSVTPDPEKVLEIFREWARAEAMTPEVCARIGALALAAPVPPLAETLAGFERWLGDGRDWPEQPLRVTGVDAESGAFVAWDRGSGAPLLAAVAASCAVPGLRAPVPIGGHRYIDGGVRSGTNADLATGYERVLIVAPLGANLDGLGRQMRRALDAEAEALCAEGSAVEVVLPDAASLEAAGPNRMDPVTRIPSARAGQEQGRALAAALREFWQG
jgi:NTE family protein